MFMRVDSNCAPTRCAHHSRLGAVRSEESSSEAPPQTAEKSALGSASLEAVLVLPRLRRGESLEGRSENLTHL